MNKKTKHKFGWKCGFEKTHGSFHPDNERCNAHSRKVFKSATDAARAGLLIHSFHANSLYVVSNSNKCMGHAVGLNFNNTKS